MNLYGVPQMEDGSILFDGDTLGFVRIGFLSPAINIGATHFWGHADFYVSINTVPVKLRKDSIKSSIYMGTYIGARVYPWSIESNEGVKPYIGFKFSPWRYKQGETPETKFKKTQIKGMLDVGFG